MSFSSIPILDLSLAKDPKTKPDFLVSLRDALLDVGFLYIENTGIDQELTENVITQGKAFFKLSSEEKLKIQMKNVPSFLGYNTLGNEITAFNTDWREQLDLSTFHPIPQNSPCPNPLYANLRAPNQWPSSALLPDFRNVYESYIREMSILSTNFTSLIAESLSLPPTAFDRFFDEDQQHKLKIVKYPDTSALPSSSFDSKSSRQGVGPHKDSMLTSYLLQVPPHKGLQAQNLQGDWIDCPPIPGTLVVAIGQGLEALTHGVCKSTTHRVLSPAPGLGPRFSIPFFQGVSYDATFEHVDIPASVLALRDERIKARKGGYIDDVEFTFEKGRWGHLGEATLMNRIKSHPDVSEKWYPDLLKMIREDQRREEKRSKEGETERPNTELVKDASISLSA